MDRALREFRIRGVKTNIPFLENVIAHPTFRSGQATTTLIDTHAGAVRVQAAPRPRDEAAELPRRRHRQRQSAREGLQARQAARCRAAPPDYDRKHAPPPGTRQTAAGTRAGEVRRVDAEAEAAADHRHDLPRCASVAAGHARAHATTCWRCADAVARRTPDLFSLEMWGGATFDTAMRFLQRRSVGAPAPAARARSEHLLPDAVPRRERRRLHELSRQCRAGFVKHAAEQRHRHLPHLRLAELPAEHEGRDGSGAGDARDLRSGDLLHRRHPRSEARRSIR